MNAKILVADDESSVRKMMTHALEERHFSVGSASDGDRALQMAGSDDYSLILLDVRMPGIDGMEVLRRLRSLQATRLVPVILVTGLGDTDEKIEGLSLGADDYVVKPFSMAELLARVERLIKRAAMELSANPLTHLPGSPCLEETVRKRIAQEEPFALLYMDIDRFKSFNDAYGFAKGDWLLKTFGGILTDSVKSVFGDDGFAAHIGGDDFAAVCRPEEAAALAHRLTCLFDQAAPCLYKPEDRRCGFVKTLDRAGNASRQPIVTIRIGVATTTSRPLTQYAQAAEIASELKCWLKEKGGLLSRFAIDRRRS